MPKMVEVQIINETECDCLSLSMGDVVWSLNKNKNRRGEGGSVKGIYDGKIFKILILDIEYEIIISYFDAFIKSYMKSHKNPLSHNICTRMDSEIPIEYVDIKPGTISGYGEYEALRQGLLILKRNNPILKNGHFRKGGGLKIDGYDQVGFMKTVSDRYVILKDKQGNLFF